MYIPLFILSCPISFKHFFQFSTCLEPHFVFEMFSVEQTIAACHLTVVMGKHLE